MHYAYCLKLNKGMVTQPKASMLRFCLLFSSAPPGGGREVAYSITVSSDSLGNWLIWMGKQTLYLKKDKIQISIILVFNNASIKV